MSRPEENNYLARKTPNALQSSERTMEKIVVVKNKLKRQEELFDSFVAQVKSNFSDLKRELNSLAVQLEKVI